MKTGYPSIDRTHLQGIPEEKLHPEILPVSMFATFMKINGEHLNETAVEADGKVYTKQELRDNAIKFAGWLLKSDIRAGDKIMIVTPNSYEGIVATFGANAIGVKVVFVKPVDTKDTNFFEELKIHHPKMVLFYDSPPIIGGTTILTNGKYVKKILIAKPQGQPYGFWETLNQTSISFEDTMKEIEAHSISQDDEPMIYLKTSGSSSKPKTLPFSNRAIFAALMYILNSSGATNRDDNIKKALCQASYYHGYGFMAVFMNIIDGNAVAMVGATPEDIANYYKVKPSIMYGSPLTLRQFMDLTPKDADLSSIVSFYCAGAALHEKDYTEGIKYFRDRGSQAEIYNNYGISEGMCIGTVNDHVDHVSGTAGKFYIGPEWLIVDENGNEVKYGEVGEVIVSAESLCQGYYGDEELTRKHFIKRDGKTFFKTGDSFSLREDGYVSFIGRERRFFIAKGIFEKVNCETVESAISDIDGVYQNAVIVTDDETGCKAFVTMRDGIKHNDATRKMLETNLAKVLSTYQMPREIIFMDSIPMMGSGKVDYKKLETV